MNKMNYDSLGLDLDYYNLYLRNYLAEHRFPEAEDDLLIAARAEQALDAFVESRLAGGEIYIASEKAMDTLYAGFEMSHYDFVSNILLEEFSDRISLEDEAVLFWTRHFLSELEKEFSGVQLSDEYLQTTDGTVFKMMITGCISMMLDDYGL